MCPVGSANDRNSRAEIVPPGTPLLQAGRSRDWDADVECDAESIRGEPAAQFFAKSPH